MRSSWLKVGTKSSDQCPYETDRHRKFRKQIQRHREEYRVKIEAEIGAMQPSIMQPRRSRATKSCKKQERFSPTAFRRSKTLPVLWFWTLSSRTVIKISSPSYFRICNTVLLTRVATVMTSIWITVIRAERGGDMGGKGWRVYRNNFKGHMDNNNGGRNGRGRQGGGQGRSGRKRQKTALEQ